jgi:hypothetical protein
MREASSSWSQLGDGDAGDGLAGRSDWSRNAKFNYVAALLARRRLNVSAVESVDDLAQVEQIAESAEIVGTITGVVRRRLSGLFWAPIGPAGWNERPAAIRQDHQNEKDTASPDAADHGERLAFESVTLAGDDHRTRNITVMGSLWPLPSMRSTRNG